MKKGVDRVKRFVCLLLCVLLLTACANGVSDTPKTTDGVTTPTDETIAPIVSSNTTTDMPTTTTTVTTEKSKVTNTGTTTTATVGVQSSAISTTVSTDSTKNNSVLGRNLPWTEPITAPFKPESANKILPTEELLFETELYEFHRMNMLTKPYVYEDGRSFTKQELQGLIDDGTVTPEQVLAADPLRVTPKDVTPCESGTTYHGTMITFSENVTATVVQGDERVRIYPPYDFMGGFYDDPYPTLGGDERWIGYYVNVPQLQQLVKAAGVDITISDDEQWLSIGDTKFICQSAVEACGIEITVDCYEDTEWVKEVIITLP